MGVKERKTRQREILRQRILDTARELFITEGYEGISMRRVAKKIEYSPTTIYLYFKDKADLFHCLCDEAFAKLIKQLEALHKDSSDPLDCLKKSLRTYVEFGLKHPNHYKIMFAIPYSEHYINLYSPVNSVGMKSYNYLCTILKECIDQKKLCKVDGETGSQVLWATVHGVTSLLITHTNFPWVNKDILIDRVINTAIKGLKR